MVLTLFEVLDMLLSMIKNDYIPESLRESRRSAWVKFDQTSALVRLVIEGKRPGILLAGQPGIGKSRLVGKCMDECGMLEGLQYICRKGRATSMGFYQLLYKNRNTLMVLDDYDRILKEKDGIAMLKAALDHDDKRTISYDSSAVDSRGLPRSFTYCGRIIFISNLQLSGIDEAVYSRCLKKDLVLTEEEILARMYELIEVMEPDTSLDIKLEIISFLNENRAELFDDDRFNLRVLSNAIAIHGTGRDDWREMVLENA